MVDKIFRATVDFLEKNQYRIFRLACCITVGLVFVSAWCLIPSTKSIVLRNKGSHPDPMTVHTRFLKYHDYKSTYNISSTDPKTCANAFTSVVRLSTQNTEYLLGETIQVEIQLFDSYKQRKTKGGDFVRVVMREENKKAITVGVVIDNNDGTYTGTLKALWTGSPQIEAIVVGPGETMEIFHRLYRDHYTLRYFIALFENDRFKEETRCLPVPQIPGITYVCNLTAENYGLPWYCGKPSHRNLLCHDLRGLAWTNKQVAQLTPQETKFFDTKLLHQKIPGRVNIKVKSVPDTRSTPYLPTTPCNKSPLRQSWEASSPVGFFYQNQWKSLTCNNTILRDPQIYRKCLKDRTVWLNGDSTSRQWVVNFRDRLGMMLVTEAWTTNKWHQPAALLHELWNIKVMYIPHEYPFYHGQQFVKLALNRATHAYLDALPSNTTDMFVIHLYLHFIPTPPELYRTHLRRIVKSVKSLLSRAPRVKIAIRGPHAYKGLSAKGLLDDIWMLPFDRILKEEFRGLEDKVLYLNNIDLTIATETDDPHPAQIAVESLIHHFMGWICE